MMFQQFVFLILGIASIKAIMDVTFEDCGVKVGCVFADEAACTSFEACPAAGIYYYNATSEMFHFQMKFTNTWAAFAQNLESATSKMGGMGGFFCTSEGEGTFGLLEGIGTGRVPTWYTEAEVTEVTNVMSASTNGVHTCSFARPMAAVSENGQKALFTLNGTDLVNIISYGVTANNGNPTQHALRAYFVSEAVTDWMMYKSEEMETTTPVPATPTTMAPNTTTMVTTMATNTTTMASNTTIMATNTTTMATNATTMATNTTTMATDATTMATDSPTIATDATTMATDATTMAGGNAGENNSSSAMLTQGSLLLVSMTLLVLSLWM